MSGTVRLCQATRKDGQPCRGAARASGFCLFHDPAEVAAGSEARAAGGRHKGALERLQRVSASRLRKSMQHPHIPGKVIELTGPEDLGGLLASLLAIFDETRWGVLDPKVATALASVAGAIVKVHERSEMERLLRRLDALEQKIDGGDYVA